MDVRVGLKESWALNNWCLWNAVLEKTLESPLNCKEILPVHAKGNQSWIFIGRTGVEAETPILWPPDAKSWLIWKYPDAGQDWGQEEKGMTEDEIDGWMASLTQWTWVGDGRESLACCSPWVAKSWMWLSDWTELECPFLPSPLAKSSSFFQAPRPEPTPKGDCSQGWVAPWPWAPGGQEVFLPSCIPVCTSPDT